ncbi:hypothetical protein [Vitiosangium sp. GDMCC 1.1324]|uniref:hypothetical protein n=1 Tax=Vitiosangium sp. (strain GDMCC 1.1324) TaxID=2138576 RepID=UPI0018EEA79E
MYPKRAARPLHRPGSLLGRPLSAALLGPSAPSLPLNRAPIPLCATSSEKSQHQNRARAEARKSQVGSGDRSERIRTYNFPQGRVTDHRINLTLYNLAKVIEGEALDDVINPLIAEDQAARLASLEEDGF